MHAMRTTVQWRTPAELRSDALEKPELASTAVLKWVQQRAADAEAGTESELGTVPVVLRSNRFLFMRKGPKEQPLLEEAARVRAMTPADRAGYLHMLQAQSDKLLRM
jgi:hypothetical protein